MTVHDRTRLIGPLGNYVDAANPSARQSAFQAFGHDHKVNALVFQGTLLALTGSRFRRRQLADLALIRRSPPEGVLPPLSGQIDSADAVSLFLPGH